MSDGVTGKNIGVGILTKEERSQGATTKHKTGEGVISDLNIGGGCTSYFRYLGWWLALDVQAVRQLLVHTTTGQLFKQTKEFWEDITLGSALLFPEGAITERYVRRKFNAQHTKYIP